VEYFPQKSLTIQFICDYQQNNQYFDTATSDAQRWISQSTEFPLYFCNYCKKLYCLQCSINKVPYIIRNELDVITKYLLLESVTIFQCANVYDNEFFQCDEFENYVKVEIWVLSFQFTNSHFHLHIIVEMKALYGASVSQNHLKLMFSIPKCL
jgi:hypothetical protein